MISRILGIFQTICHCVPGYTKEVQNPDGVQVIFTVLVLILVWYIIITCYSNLINSVSRSTLCPSIKLLGQPCVLRSNLYILPPSNACVCFCTCANIKSMCEHFIVLLIFVVISSFVLAGSYLCLLYRYRGSFVGFDPWSPSPSPF